MRAFVLWFSLLASTQAVSGMISDRDGIRGCNPKSIICAQEETS